MSLKRIASPTFIKAGSRLFSTSRPQNADYTHAVIGAGAVGLAIARQLAARDGTSTVIIEKHGSVGQETSSRNSEVGYSTRRRRAVTMLTKELQVIHAGLYYGYNTLKTDLCLKGKHMMYDLCAKQNIPHRNTRKWILAQDEQQMGELEKVHNFAQSIGVPTRFLLKDEVSEREPDVRAEAGVLESESTGIVDSHSFMQYLEGDYQDKGGDCAFHSSVKSIEAINGGKGGYRIHYTSDEPGDHSVEVETLINSAGLFAIPVSNMVLPKERHRKSYYAKGSYFSYSASTPKPKTLLYPAPVPGFGGLGTHLTLDITGRVRFGPDVEWVDDPTDLRPDPKRMQDAIGMILSYLPSIKRAAIDLDYCGIRPKLGKTGSTAGKNFADFYIKEEEDFPGFVNLLGIESPGLTSSLAIGEMVEKILYK